MQLRFDDEVEIKDRKEKAGLLSSQSSQNDVDAFVREQQKLTGSGGYDHTNRSYHIKNHIRQWSFVSGEIAVADGSHWNLQSEIIRKFPVGGVGESKRRLQNQSAITRGLKDVYDKEKRIRDKAAGRETPKMYVV